MTTYRIPEPLYGKYQGAGYAVAAILNKEVVGLTYLHDVFDDFEDDIQNKADEQSYLKRFISDDRLGPTIRYLQSLGDVLFGTCADHAFAEL